MLFSKDCCKQHEKRQETKNDCPRNPQGRKHPPPRPIDKVGYFQSNEQDCQKTTEANSTTVLYNPFTHQKVPSLPW